MKLAFSLDAASSNFHYTNMNKAANKYYWEEMLSLVPVAGFEAVDFPYDGGARGPRTGQPYCRPSVMFKYGGIEGLKALLEEDGIKKVAGIQFVPRPAATVDEYVAAYAADLKKHLVFANELGCDYIAASASPEIAYMGALLEKKDELLEKFAAALADAADAAGNVKICLRNEYWSVLRGNELLDFIKKVDSRIGVCVDLAHLSIAGVCPIEFIKACADRIDCVVLSDTDFVDEFDSYKDPYPQHPTKYPTHVFKDLGCGNIDLKAVFAALKEIGYEGWLTASNRQTRDLYRGMLRAMRAIKAAQ